MSLATLFGFRSSNGSEELCDIFPMQVVEKDFVGIDVQNTYTRILTDVLERTQGIPENLSPLLWDNCLKNESAEGLVTMIAKAMSEKTELFLVYDKAVKLVRKATSLEEADIKADYLKTGESKVGVYVSFKKYDRTDMVRLYSALDYATVAALSKSMNLSKAIQLKLNELRSSVGLTDAADVKAQAQRMAQGLKEGKDIMMDGKDTVETAKPDLTAVNSAEQMISRRLSRYLGMPASYITGEQKNSMGDTGTGDARAVERGLKNYYVSIAKPVIEAVFSIKTTFESEDFEQISTSLEALKTFDVTSDEHLSKDNKTIVINKLFGLPEETKGDAPEKVQPPQLPVSGNPKAPNAPPPNEAKP